MGLSEPMFFVGVVEDNKDGRNEGRVRVRALGVHGTHEQISTQDLPWAICIAGSYDPNYQPPPLNSFVFGAFMDGRQAQHPLILGMIPTQYAEAMNPNSDGYGVISEDGPDDPLAKGFRPDDFGIHQRSKLGRGEDDIADDKSVYIKEVNANRKYNQRIADSDQTWNQPPTAYAAKYPYNRVIETAKHVIELDDTPGAERIMIAHRGDEGNSFIQIDSKGTVTEKAKGDRYEINDGTKHESSNHSVVTINGNAHVYVKGNKTEEVEGDYKLLVRGNAMFGVAKQMTINSGVQLQARSADVKIEANSGIMTLFGKNEIQFEAEKQLNFVANNIKHNALLDYAVYSTKGIKFSTPLDIHTVSSNMIITCTGLVPPSTVAQPVTGTIGESISVGLNVVSPGVNIAAVNGSFTGIFNATTVNAGAVTATAMNTPLLTATAVTATTGNFTTLGAPLPAGPVSYNALYKAPVVSVTIPTIPALIPPAVSNPSPPLFGIASGWAYPVGNGPKFITSVLTSPFSFMTGFLPPIDEGGYGMTRAQIPEPPAESTAPPGIQANGYYAKGYSAGFMTADDSIEE